MAELRCTVPHLSVVAHWREGVGATHQYCVVQVVAHPLHTDHGTRSLGVHQYMMVVLTLLLRKERGEGRQGKKEGELYGIGVVKAPMYTI